MKIQDLPWRRRRRQPRVHFDRWIEPGELTFFDGQTGVDQITVDGGVAGSMIATRRPIRLTVSRDVISPTVLNGSRGPKAHISLSGLNSSISVGGCIEHARVCLTGKSLVVGGAVMPDAHVHTRAAEVTFHDDVANGSLIIEPLGYNEVSLTIQGVTIKLPPAQRNDPAWQPYILPPAGEVPGEDATAYHTRVLALLDPLCVYCEELRTKWPTPPVGHTDH